jgi:Uma2 family endonuclease
MATLSGRKTPPEIDYPTSDGRPMAETDDHRDLMLTLIETLKMDRAADPHFYVSGNLLVFYEKGNRRRHVSPDVFVVRGVSKHNRDHYLIWKEGKGPELAIELTSKSTRQEDVEDKFQLYQNVLKITEYFLFDPHRDYLKPALQGYRLSKGRYIRIEPEADRLPSEVLGLHLEQADKELRLYNPETSHWLPTPQEALKAEQTANETLRRELEKLRRRTRKDG